MAFEKEAAASRDVDSVEANLSNVTRTIKQKKNVAQGDIMQ